MATTKLSILKGHLSTLRSQIESYVAKKGKWPSLRKLRKFGIPVNPYNSLNTVRKPRGTFTCGWVYDKRTGEIHPDDLGGHRGL